MATARAAYRRALWRTLVFLGALAFVGWSMARALIVTDVAMLLVIVCVGFDLAGELQFRRTHPDVIAVTAEHRLYAVGPALGALTTSGIASFPRALRHRTLLAFWGPYLPIEILVPRSQAAAARAALSRDPDQG